jgi:hypothetical protein
MGREEEIGGRLEEVWKGETRGEGQARKVDKVTAVLSEVQGVVKEELNQTEGGTLTEETSRSAQERVGWEGEERKSKHEDNGIDSLQGVEGEEGWGEETAGQEGETGKEKETHGHAWGEKRRWRSPSGLRVEQELVEDQREA